MFNHFWAWAWIVCGAIIGITYAAVVSRQLHALLTHAKKPMAAQWSSWFVHSCGLGHIAMISFMALSNLSHNPDAFKVVVIIDFITMISTVGFAFIAYRKR